MDPPPALEPHGHPTWPMRASLTLTGGRASAVRTLVLAAMLSGLLGAVAILLPAHCMKDGVCHSSYQHTGPGAIAMCLGVAGVAWFGRRWGFGVGVAVGIGALATAFVMLGSLMLAHLFDPYRSELGDGLVGLALFGLALSGLALVIGEPLAYVHERRRVLAAQNTLPAARVHR